TTFATGLTNDLEPTFGFIPIHDLWGNYKGAIIVLIVSALVNSAIYFISQTKKNYFGHSDDIFKKYGNVISGGLFVIPHSTVATQFTFSDADSKPEISLARIEEIFGKDFAATAPYRAIADLLVKNLPLLIIQIIYFRSIVTYSIIPFLVLVTTSFKIILSVIQSILKILDNRKQKVGREKDEKVNAESDEVSA
ncbi:9955_t:CDS:2, partial [Dentiscutata heterogama]